MPNCSHTRLNEEGYCRKCSADCRGSIGSIEAPIQHFCLDPQEKKCVARALQIAITFYADDSEQLRIANCPISSEDARRKAAECQRLLDEIYESDVSIISREF